MRAMLQERPPELTDAEFEQVLEAVRSVPPHFSGLLSILKDALITRVLNETAAGQTALNSTALDMQTFDSVLFIALLGTVTDNSVMTLSVLSNPTNSNSGGTTEKAGTAITAATSSNLVMATEAHKP